MKSYEEQIREGVDRGCGTAKYMEIESRLQECYREIRDGEIKLAAGEMTSEQFYKVMFGKVGLYQCKERLESMRETMLSG